MRRLSRMLALCLAAASMSVPLYGQATLTIDGQTTVVKELGSVATFEVNAPAGSTVFLLSDTDPGPTFIFGQWVPIGISPNLASTPLGITPDSGVITHTIQATWDEAAHSSTLFFVAVALQGGSVTVTNGANATTVARPQLAGNSLATYPHFEHVSAFNRGATVELGLDLRHSAVNGETVDVFVVPSKTSTEWLTNPALNDVRGGPQTITFPQDSATSIQQRTWTLSGVLPGPDETPLSNDTRIGVGYDLVIDRNRNGVFDNDFDLIDGFDEDEAGFYVVRDTAADGAVTGPLAVATAKYIAAQGKFQETYYPQAIGQMGLLPLVVIAHGAGITYKDYGHIGRHLAAYGYVVMVYEGAGNQNGEAFLMEQIDFLLNNLALPAVAGGVLDGHLDGSEIVLMGHSNGGGAVVNVYDQFVRFPNGGTGLYQPQRFDRNSIKLISCLAPNHTNQVGWPATPGPDPHDVVLHVLITPADLQLPGCGDDSPLLMHERCTNFRYVTSLYGAGHEDINDGTPGAANAQGPDLIGQANTHAIIRGYLLPLLEHHVRGDLASRDFLWRQYEAFHAIGSPDFTSGPKPSEITVNLSATDPTSVKIDDFQTQPSTAVASSGAGVTMSITATEGSMHDANSSFVIVPPDPFNGFTYDAPPNAGATTGSRGSVFSFGPVASEVISYDLTMASPVIQFRDFEYLSFRAAQGTRHPLTDQLPPGDVTFDVRLVDANGNTSTINIGAYEGGVEKPYQRSSFDCGMSMIGTGWTSEFERIRIRLADFVNDGTNLDLSNITDLEFLFGSDHGSDRGRIGLDEIELLR